MKVAITGETGFLGYYLTQYLKYNKQFEVIELGRDYQKNISKLKQCDWLFHCAAVNRGNDVGITNISITNNLVKLLDNNDIKINISFMSSIQEDTNNEYGNSKLECKNILHQYSIRSNTKFISYKLPNLFGPFGKPNYNSVVATFCHNIINGIDCVVNNNDVSLCYVGDVVDIISSLTECENFQTHNITITDLYKMLLDFHKNYSQGIIPTLDCNFKIQLFNTYRSYSNNIHKFIRHSDERGYLIELLKSGTNQSQVFFSTTNPGVTRGNHFHFNKIERFCILKGTAEISIRKIGTDEKISYIINNIDDTVIDMPVLYTHNITNIGNTELICVFWVNEIFDTNLPDTYFIEV